MEFAFAAEDFPDVDGVWMQLEENARLISVVMRK
jgi:hypothetical protein